MKRKITLLVCIGLAITMIFGACAGDVKVGEIDGKPVYKSELESWIKMMGGTSDMLTDPDYADSLSEILDAFMSVKVLNAELVKRGYLNNMTSDQIAQAEQYAQNDIDTSIQNYGKTEEEVLKTIGLTKEQLIEQYKFNIAGNTAFTELVGDIKPTEEQIRQEYDSIIASRKEEMDADPTLYVSDVNSGADIFYTPAGIRMVRKLLIAIDADTADAISILRNQGYDSQAEVLLTDALTKIRAEADEVSGKISSGLSFSDAMAQYNDDKSASDNGYPVVSGTTDYPDKFIEKAMALTSVGQISEVFATDEGYQIVEYLSDLTPGAVQYESVKDKVSESLLTNVQTDAWLAMIDQWKTEHNVKTFIENLKAQPSPATTEASAAPAK